MAAATGRRRGRLTDAGVTDEFIVPVVCEGGAAIQPEDSVVFFNFRPDRAREITRTLVDPDFSGFPRRGGCFPLTYVCMTQYDATMPGVQVAFPPQSLVNTFGAYVSEKGSPSCASPETGKIRPCDLLLQRRGGDRYPGEDRRCSSTPRRWPLMTCSRR